MTDMQIDLYPCNQRKPIVWGNVYDNCNNPMQGVLVQLVQYQDGCMSCGLVVCETYSDCCGRYEMQLPSCPKGKYRVEAGCGEPTRCRHKTKQNNICYY